MLPRKPKLKRIRLRLLDLKLRFLRLKKAEWMRPIIYIVMIIGLAGIGIITLSSPSIKEVDIDVRCQSFRLPFDLIVNLNQQPAQPIHLRGFKGQLERIDDLIVEANEKRYTFADRPQLTFAYSKSDQFSPLPSFLLQPQPRYGPMSIAIKAGAELIPVNPSPGQAPNVSIKSNGSHDILLQLEMDEVSRLEVNRASIPELKAVAGLEDQIYFNLVASNKRTMVKATFESNEVKSPNPAETTMLTFSQGETPVNLIKDVESSQQHVVQNTLLNLTACPDPDIKIEGKDAANKVKSRALDINLQANQFVLTQLSFYPSQKVEEGSTIRVTGRGLVTSIRQGSTELLPSRLEEILSEPPEQRGLYGMVAILGISAGYVFLSRALNVLANILIPDPKQKK